MDRQPGKHRETYSLYYVTLPILNDEVNIVDGNGASEK